MHADMDKAEKLGLRVVYKDPSKKKKVDKLWSEMMTKMFGGDDNAIQDLIKTYEKMLK